MRCARCHRDMIRAYAWIGTSLPVGPRCAEIMGITAESDGHFVARITRTAAQPIDVPIEQMALEFES